VRETEYFYYQYEISQVSVSAEVNLREQIEIARRFVSQYCTRWICQECFNNKFIPDEMGLVCENCATIDTASSELWTNKICQSPIRIGYGLESTHVMNNNYERTIKLFTILGKLHADSVDSTTSGTYVW
jgi:hypothetical protein